MIPVLFKEDEQIFSHNGIGALYESLSCDIWETENGSFTMELEYPVDGELFSELEDYRIIQAKPNDIDEPHNFRIYEIDKSIDELTVYVRANTITNDLGSNLITSYVARNQTPQQAMNGAKLKLIEPTNFDLISDIQTRSNTEWTRINPLNAIVGVEGSLVDIWGGEIKRTNNAIYLYSRRGRDKVATIRPGKNIEGLTMTVSTAGITTKVLPTYTYRPTEIPKYQMVTLSDGTREKRRVQNTGDTRIQEDITVLGDVVTSQYVNNYPMNHWRSVDYNDDEDLRETIDTFVNDRLEEAEESSSIIDNSNFPAELKSFVKTELDKRAAQYFTHRNPGVDQPTVRISVNMLQLADSPEWEEFKDLERIGLTDTVEVWVEEYDIDVDVRVTELQYDSLGERVKKFTAGSDRAPRQSVQEKQYADLTKSLKEYKTTVENGVNNIMRNTADGLNRKFEGYTEPPAELSSEGDIWFKEIGSGKVEIWIHDGVYWQPLLTEDFGKQLEADIEAVQSELDEAKLQAVADSEQALEDAKAYADAEDARIRGELESDIGGAIELAEQAKADAVSKANQALVDAKAHAEAEDARIQQEIGLEVDGAIEIAEQAKQDAIDKSNQALADAKAHADAEIALIGTHFDGIIEGVESDVADAKQTADTAIYKIDNDIANKFTSLDAEVLSIETISNSAQTNAQTALNQSIDALEDASTALTNAQTALNRADTAIGSASDAATLAGNALTKADEAQDAATILSGQVSGFETTVAGFNQIVNNYEGQVSGFRNDILGLESTVASYESEVDEFGNTVSTYATEVSTMRNTVSGFESTVATYGIEVSDLAGEVLGYKNQVSTFNNTVTGFNSTVANYTTEVNEFGLEVESYATEVSTLTNTVSGFQSTVTKVEQDYAGISGTVATHTSEISNLNGEIALKANTTTVNALTGRVTTAETGITTNANDIKLKASQSSVDTLTGRVNTAETSITANATAIGLKANQTTVDTLSGTVNSLGADVGVVAGQISSKVWNTDIETAIDGIEVGGRNLIPSSVLRGESYTTKEFEFSGWSVRLINTEDTSRILEEGKEYTISYDMELTEVTDIPTLFARQTGLYLYSSGGHGSGDFAYTSNLSKKGDKYRYEKTFIAPKIVDHTVLIYSNRYTTNGNSPIGYDTLRITNLKLEKGNKATDWTPAPEDTTALIDHVESELTQKYDSITATVSSIDGRVATNTLDLDGLTTTVQSVRTDLTGTTTLLNTTKTTVDSHTSTIATLRTDVDGKATTAQFNTLTSTVNGTIQRVGNAEGKITTIETNVSGLQTTVASKAAQSEVTQLATGLSSVVTDLSNLEIGGRNLLLNTGFTDGVTGWSGGSIDVIDGVPVAKVTGTMSENGRLPLEPNQYYTASMEIYPTVDIPIGSNTPLHTYYRSSAGNNGGIDTKTVPKQGSVAKANEWTRITETVKTNQDVTTFKFHVYYPAYINSTTPAYVKNIKLEKGNKATDWTPAPEDTQSQITQLADNINLRVVKGEVLSQINIEANQTLIQSNKLVLDASSVIFTGSAFIPSAQIESIDAAKITAGTISTARLNTSAIVTAGLTANVIKSTHIETSTATINKIFATDAMVNTLTAKTAFINSVKAVDISAARITSGTISAARLNASAIVTAGLTANVITSTHIATSTATIDKLFANETMISRLTSKTAFINNIKAVNIDAARITSGTINAARLNASAIVTAGLTANVVKATHIHADTATFDKLFSTTSATDRLSARSAWIKGANIIDATISTAKIANLAVTSGKIASLDVSKISGNHMSFITGAFTASNGDISINGNQIQINSVDYANMRINRNNVEFSRSDGIIVGGLVATHNPFRPGSPIGLSLVTARSGQDAGIGRYIGSGEHIPSLVANGTTGNMEAYNSITMDTGTTLSFRGGGYITEQNQSLIIRNNSANAVQIDTGVPGAHTNATRASFSEHGIHFLRNVNMNGYRILNPTNIEGASIIESGWFRGRNNTSLSFAYNSGGTSEEKFRIMSDGIRMYSSVNFNSYHLNHVGSLNYASDARMKDDIIDRTENDLATILSINYKDYYMNGQKQRGFIAQELQLIDRDLITESDDGMLGYDGQGYTHTIGHAVQQLALRELNTNQVASQALQLGESNKSEIDELREENKELRNRIEELESAS